MWGAEGRVVEEADVLEKEKVILVRQGMGCFLRDGFDNKTYTFNRHDDGVLQWR